MNAALGHTGVLLGLAAAVVGIVVMAIGLAKGRDTVIRNAQIYAPVILLGGLVATAAMEHALVTHDFSLVYVADNNSTSTPLLYSITGMWSALEGSILLWGVILGGYATAMVWRFRKRGSDRLVAWATLVVYVVAAFFFMLMLGPADPFRRVAGAVVTNGNGPNVALAGQPAGGLPPAHAVPGIRRVHPPLRLRRGLAHHRAARRGLAERDPAVDPVRLGVPHRRHPARDVVVLPGAGLGRLLGMGPGRERRRSCRGCAAPPTSIR